MRRPSVLTAPRQGRIVYRADTVAKRSASGDRRRSIGSNGSSVRRRSLCAGKHHRWEWGTR